MGLFKWRVYLGDPKYGQVIADGWVRADSTTEAEAKVAAHYADQYHTVELDDEYDPFGDTELMCELRTYTVYSNGVVVRWSD